MIYKGQINSKIVKKAKTGAEYAVFEVNDKKFNCFDALIVKEFQEGDNVEIETKTNGKYENMFSMKKIDAEAPKEQNKPIPTLKPIPQEFHQSIEACRYEALDITMKYLKLREEKPTMDLVLNMANVYLEFIQGKIDGMYAKEGK